MDKIGATTPASKRIEKFLYRAFAIDMNEKILDATPEKRLFLSIISEYDLTRSICELIDNAIDLWSKAKRTDIEIEISADATQQFLSIEDNAGGIEESRLDHLISPGKTSNDIRDDVIGYFGVGSKRAVVALAQDIAIHSRFQHERTYVVKLDEHWITEDPSWHLPYSESNKSLKPSTTLIELTRLRVQISDSEIDKLRTYVSEVYARFIDRGAKIAINGESVSATNFDDEWAYPPDYFPTTFSMVVPIEEREVQVEIQSGLIDHSGDPDNSYGIFVYCNNRLIARALTDFSVGFSRGLIGNPHYNISLVRTIVRIRGQSRDMPWDSRKSNVDTKHQVFQAIQQAIIDVTKRYSQVSRSLQGTWDTTVFPYKTGRVLEQELPNAQGIPKTYLPTPPPSKLRWHQRLIARNSNALASKPWSVGLLDSIIAADLIAKSNLSQKNRIALIILDSTIEIAYKEFLVNEKKIGNNRFKQISENRTAVQDEVKDHLDVSPETFGKIDHYYRLRCDLIHQRATPNVTDDQISEYREIAQTLLHDMFDLEFV